MAHGKEGGNGKELVGSAGSAWKTSGRDLDGTNGMRLDATLGLAVDTTRRQ